MRQSVSLLLCALLVTPACATSRGARLQTGPQSTMGADPALLATYLKALPIGSRVRVTLTDGNRIRGTLMTVSDNDIVVQESARLPEPPVRVAMQEIRAVEPDKPGGGTGRAIAIGAAVGAGAAVGVLMIIVALISYD